ncbi:hypothetical protein MRX96_018597 [Rhipicephalus microplus]
MPSPAKSVPPMASRSSVTAPAVRSEPEPPERIHPAQPLLPQLAVAAAGAVRHRLHTCHGFTECFLERVICVHTLAANM